jgi:hypothetical protein
MNWVDMLWVSVTIWLIVSTWKGRKSSVKMEVKQNMHVKELGLSSQTWQAFCHLAAARRVSQTNQIGEAIMHYMEDSKII